LTLPRSKPASLRKTVTMVSSFACKAGQAPGESFSEPAVYRRVNESPAFFSA